MLSSIILSLVMSTTPVTAIDNATSIETTNLHVQEINKKRGSIRMNKKRGSIRMNKKRGSIRM